MPMSKRKELLTGVLVGLYGNWLIQLLDKIQNANNLSLIFFTLSCGLLVGFFMDLFDDKPTWIRGISTRHIIGGAHIFTIYTSIFFSELYLDNIFFVSTGAFFWFVLLSQSTKI